MHSSQQKKGISLTVAVIVAIMSVLFGIYFSNIWQAKKERDFVNQFEGTLFGIPRVVDDFSFAGTNNQAFSKESLKGHWSLVFFGFTNCPMLCPTTMNQLGKFYKSLENQKVKNLPQVVMVSLDPNRDSIDKLKNYVSAFDSHFMGAVGSQGEVSKLTKSLGVVHIKEEGKNKNYNIEHSGAILIFNPDGEWKGFFSSVPELKKMTEDYVRLVG